MTTLTIRRAAATPQRLAGRSLTAAPAAWVAGSLSLSAALVHADGVSAHYTQWPPHGLFFLACAIAQALLAVLVVWRPGTTWIPMAGIAGNLAILGMYVYSRTNGPPGGPHEGVPEDAGVIDLGTAAVE